MDSSHRNSLQPGHLVHWYKIKKILGQGGFGITYLAIDTNLNQQVAIKEYLPVELAVRDSNNSLYPISDNRHDQYSLGLSRFIEEAQTLAKFDHQNIVRVLTVFEANNTAYMVMRYEEGESLQNILKARKTLNEKTLKNILFPILDGLEKVHAEGLIHRDIKPANIYIRENGSPVLLDFGAARQSLGEATKTLTSMFSSGYAPFEQYFSKSDQQGPWTDIYGLGATMYRGITSKMPMDAVDRSNAILQLSRDTFVYAAEIGQEDYSEAFLKAVDSALQFKYQERPQSIIDWKSEFKLQRFIADKKPAIKVKQQDIPTKEATQTNNTPEAKTRKSRSIPKIAVAASIILVIFVASYYFYDESGFNLKNDAQVLPEKKALTAQEEIELRRQELKLLEDKAEQERLKAEALAKLEEEKKRKAAEEEADKQLKIRDLLAEAKDLISKNDFSTAKNIIIKALQVDPESKEVKKSQTMLDAAIAKAKQEKAKLAEENRLAEEKSKKAEADKQLEMKRLLSQANQFMKDKHLIEPEGKNALTAYRIILEIEPENQEATRGITNVVNALVAESKILIERSDFASAEKKLEQAKEIKPNAKEIVQGQTLLDDAITKANTEGVNALIVQIYKAIEGEEFKLAKKLLAEAVVLDPDSENLKTTNKNYETQYSNWQKEQKLIEEVKKLLTSAKSNLDNKRLTTPKGNNALEQYQAVLKLEPGNETAKEGVQIIFNQYIALAQESIKAESYEKGKIYIDKANQIIPDSQEVKTITDELAPKLADIENTRKEEEAKAEKLAEEKHFAEQKKLEEDAALKRLAEEKKQAAEKQLTEAKVAKEQEEKRLAEEAAEKLANSSKVGEFVKITGGVFDISGNSVTIAPFEIGKYEVTQGQWQDIMGSNPSQFKDCKDCPVDRVNWKDVQGFIQKLNAQSKIKYRLPTVAEWLYVCRNGGDSGNCGGNNFDAIHTSVSSGKLKTVGLSRANQFGIHDIISNAWEWTCSQYSENYNSNWLTCRDANSNFTPEIRGGKKGYIPTDSRNAQRAYLSAHLKTQTLGFRLVVSK